MSAICVKRSCRQRGNTIAEFGPVLWVFLICILIPFIDLISFGTGVATVMLMASFGARQATGAMTFTDAVQGVNGVQNQLTGYFKLVRATAVGAGVKVEVVVTTINGQTAAPGSPFTFANRAAIPNLPGSDPSNPAFNTDNSVYQYLVTADYNILPIFNMSATPFFKSIPIIGAPAHITYTGTSNVEHPEGLHR